MAREEIAAANHKRMGFKRLIPQRLVIFDEERVNRLTDSIVALIEQGLYGEELLNKCLGELRNEIKCSVSAEFIGEKSPQNLLSIARFGLLGARAAILMKREPYSFMRSMRKTNTGSETFDAAFRKSLWQMIGIYRLYAGALAKLTPSPTVNVVDYYTDLIDAPAALAERIFKVVGLSTHPEAIVAAASWVQPQAMGRSWESFNPSEQALIWRLTADARRTLGYDAEYFNAKAPFIEPSDSSFDVESNRVHVLSGFFPTGQSDNLWLEEEGWLAVESRSECRTITLRFWASFPPSALSSGESATIQAFGFDESGEKFLGACTLDGSKPSFATIPLALDDFAPLLENRSGAVRMLILRPSHTFNPINLPASDGTGAGIMRISAMMLAPAFEGAA
ncbi:MAG: sulfotransferase [Alphaproteobacteria bacterium]|nr:sulfotransferase [Alphaproteobacteria bacterium]MBM3652743.1 sulfotransferase [Alphaproteobacteria bacterium]